MRPWDKYQQHLARPDFEPDPAQREAVLRLDDLYQRLLARDRLPSQQTATGDSWLRRWLGKGAATTPLPPERGIYLWGGVGRGKTYLVDLFFQCLPMEHKRRIHFHRFMSRVHHELGELQQQPDPLLRIADTLARESRLICFDEFFVADITDAMLLGTLIQALFDRGVTLVATSNIPPDELYRNGLQRARFLPAIAAIKRHCEILQLDNGIDYRRRTLEQAEIYHWPLDRQAEQNLLRYFEQLAPAPLQCRQPLEIAGRSIPVRAQADGVLLMEFEALCEGPRSQVDYMEIARIYHTVLLANVCRMGIDGDDVARRFIALVDEFYERRVKLIISAEVALAELYPVEGRLHVEFERCLSRLQEMQSHRYLAEPHRP